MTGHPLAYTNARQPTGFRVWNRFAGWTLHAIYARLRATPTRRVRAPRAVPERFRNGAVMCHRIVGQRVGFIGQRLVSSEDKKALEEDA